MKTRHFLALLLFCATLPAARADDDQTMTWIEDRIEVNARINGKPACFFYDTGAETTALLASSAARLGLKTSPIAGEYAAQYKALGRLKSEECNLEIGPVSTKATFMVVNTHPVMSMALKGMKFDGVLGWSDFKPGAGYVLLIDGGKHTVGFEQMPADIRKWTMWKILPDTTVLKFESTGTGGKLVVGLDTGAGDGLQLSPSRWEKWHASQAGKPYTMDASLMPGIGQGMLLIDEVFRAREMALGVLF